MKFDRVNLLRLYLAQCDERCPNCHYPLRGLTTGTCPECEQRLTLRVSLEDSVTSTWLMCVLPQWLSCGAFVIFLILVGSMELKDRLTGGPTVSTNAERFWLYLYPALALMIMLPIAVMLTKAKGRAWLTMPIRRAHAPRLLIGLSSVITITWILGLVSTS